MQRVRVLRIVVPVLLVPVLVLVVLNYRRRPDTGAAAPRRAHPGTSVERIELFDILGKTVRASIHARAAQELAGGGLHLEGIERLEIERDDAPPLVIKAAEGHLGGPAGGRTVRVEGGVTVLDEQEGIALSLAALDVDEASAELRSRGEVKLESPRLRGSAGSVVYGLRKQPTRLTEPRFETDLGQRLRATEAILHDGTRDAEFVGQVGIEGDEGTLSAARLRLLRAEGRSAQRALASGGVSGQSSSVLGAVRSFRSDRAEMDWDAEGGVERLLLEGSAQVAQTDGTIDASWIEAHRPAGSEADWAIRARRTVRVTGRSPEGPITLAADELEALLTAAGVVSRAEARGNVRYRGPDATAEGDRGEMWTESGGRRAVLHAGPGARKARITSGRSRVAADRIETDASGEKLLALGRVEATLLPDPSAGGRRGPAATMGPFARGDAVHFVAASLAASHRGSRLVFTGSVRGWQGERSITAPRIEMEQGEETLVAEGGVHSRLPRASGAAVSEADYIQVSADRLDYRGKAGKAVYEGHVRMRQAEGWLEASRLEADLVEGGGARQFLASGEVRFAFRSTSSRDGPTEVTGQGDRAIYLTAERLVRVFGDKAPAMVSRAGKDGGTTTGRVLRYGMETGELEVESGTRDRARIRATGK